jgi:DNA modification methylase
MLEINKIHLGDSYELIKQIPDKSVDCVYIDIPYLIASGGGGSSELAKRIIKIQHKDIADISNGIEYRILKDLTRIMKKINIFIWCSKLQLLDLMNYFNKPNINFELLTWNKLNPTPQTNNVWLPDIEYCLYFRESRVKLNDGYELKSKWFTSPINKPDKDLYDHPTIKPLELVKRHLAHATQPNDLILDCFSGSGTTCVAAKELGRRFIGIEIDPNYHKISVDRLNGITSNGQTSIFTDFEVLE